MKSQPHGRQVLWQRRQAGGEQLHAGATAAAEDCRAPGPPLQLVRAAACCPVSHLWPGRGKRAQASWARCVGSTPSQQQMWPQEAASTGKLMTADTCVWQVPFLARKWPHWKTRWLTRAPKECKSCLPCSRLHVRPPMCHPGHLSLVSCTFSPVSLAQQGLVVSRDAAEPPAGLKTAARH